MPDLHLRCRGHLLGYFFCGRAAIELRAPCGWTTRRIPGHHRYGRLPLRLRRPCARCGAGLEPVTALGEQWARILACLDRLGRAGGDPHA